MEAVDGGRYQECGSALGTDRLAVGVILDATRPSASDRKDSTPRHGRLLHPSSWTERDDRDHAADNFFQGGSPKQATLLPRWRPVDRGPDVFLGKALVAQRGRERDRRDKPTTSTKRSGQFPKNPTRHRGVIAKIGYVTQRSGVFSKSSFAAFSGKGHEANSEFHASPPTGGFHHGGVSL